METDFKPATKEVLEIAKINLMAEAYVVLPEKWLLALKTDAGLPDLIGAIILGYIVFRYKPQFIEGKDGETLVGRFFKGSNYELNHAELKKHFGLTDMQIRHALRRLETAGLFTRKIKQTQSGRVVEILINPLAIEVLTYDGRIEQKELSATGKNALSKKAKMPAAEGQKCPDSKETYKEDLTKNPNSFVETSSTPESEGNNSDPLNIKKEESVKTPQSPPFLATATDDEAAPLTADPKNQFPEVGKLVTPETPVETPQTTETGKDATKAKKTAQNARKAANTPIKSKTKDVILYKPEELDALTADQASEAVTEAMANVKEALNQIINNATPTEKEAPNKQAHTACVRWFCEVFYPERYETKYGFAPKDAKAVKEILKFFLLKKPDANQNQLLAMFQNFIQKTKNDFVLKNDHCLTIVWGQQNQIFNELQKNKKDAQQTPKIEIARPTDEYCKW